MKLLKISNCHECPNLTTTNDDYYFRKRKKTFHYVCLEHSKNTEVFCIKTGLTTKELMEDCPLPDILYCEKQEKRIKLLKNVNKVNKKKIKRLEKQNKNMSHNWDKMMDLENNWRKCKRANNKLREENEHLKKLINDKMEEPSQYYGCSSCQYYEYRERPYQVEGSCDYGDSWCAKKNRKLYFLERNWINVDYEYSCFRKKKIDGMW